MMIGSGSRSLWPAYIHQNLNPFPSRRGELDVLIQETVPQKHRGFHRYQVVGLWSIEWIMSSYLLSQPVSSKVLRRCVTFKKMGMRYRGCGKQDGSRRASVYIQATGRLEWVLLFLSKTVSLGEVLSWFLVTVQNHLEKWKTWGRHYRRAE